jgi:GDP-mannose 6-dehydrogenase
VIVSVFGLGYVGVVTAACLARDGHEVVGVDVNADKVTAIAAGKSPIIEPGLAALLSDGVAVGRVRATTDFEAAVRDTDASLISVGTPSSSRGGPDLSHVMAVCAQIADVLAVKSAPHVIVLRSTVPPGTLAQCADVIRDKAPDAQVGFAFNPEFLREGSALADFDRPAYTIIGTADAGAEAAVRGLYAKVDAPVLVVPPEVAEMVKYVANCWHAAKIGFANEIGRIAKSFGVDGRTVMDIITQDTKLNVSPVYMKPGFAYGGSCLPKDVRALLFHANERGVQVPILAGLPVSNQLHIDAAADLVLRTRPKRAAILGLAFKSNTDDLRESPAVTLTKRLIGEGCEVRIYAPDVYEARLMGTNLAYIRENIPHFEHLLIDDAAAAIDWADVVVVTHPQAQFTEALEHTPAGTRIVDLAGVFAGDPQLGEYDGIAW